MILLLCCVEKRKETIRSYELQYNINFHSWNNYFHNETKLILPYFLIGRRVLKFSYLYKIFNKRTEAHPEVNCKSVVLKNVAKFTGKHLVSETPFYKVAGGSVSTGVCHRYFSVNYAKFLRALFLNSAAWWQLLEDVSFLFENQIY